MHAYRTYYPSHRTARRFSGVLRTWFPAMHQKAFPGTTAAGILRSAALRTADRT